MGAVFTIWRPFCYFLLHGGGFFWARPSHYENFCGRPCARTFLLPFFTMLTAFRGVPRIREGGGPRIFFQIWEFACRGAMRIARGFGSMLPRANFLKWCNLVRFRVYFDQILYLFFFKNYHFLYKK